METVVSAMFGVVLEKLGSPALEKFMKLLNKGKKTNKAKIIDEWKAELLFIQGLLNDAEQIQGKNEAVKFWLDNLKDFAFDLEDTLDDFTEEALTRHLKTAHDDDDDDVVVVDRVKKRGRGVLGLSFYDMVGSVLACGCGATLLLRYSGPDFSSKIDEISSRLNKLRIQATTLNLSTLTIQQPTYPLGGQQTGRRESTSVIEDIVYGRDVEKERIIRCLIEDEPNYMNYVVIPIVGMGGIGKTTLAQCLYNDEQLKDHFDLMAWVCVSDVFDVQRITKDIIDSATNGNFVCSALNQAHVELKKKLKDKKFLLVLDDIWCEEYDKWRQLQVPFGCGARGSRVIVTTRHETVAKTVKNNNCHSNMIYLKFLSDEDCWCLFKQHAIEYIDLAERKDDIVQKCKGLPLAAIALGGLLKKTTLKSERQRILDSDIWNEDSTVLPVLRLSYHHLPSHLKHLFAYCSVIPKDYEFEEMEVIQLWMAQGFLPGNKNERMEDKGHSCFLDLVSRSFFEKGLFGRFIMHDLIHDLAKWAAGDQCCVLDSTNMQKDLKRTRHLSVTKNGIDETFGIQLLTPRLRTFLCSSYDLNIEILDVQRFRFLRTLSLRLRLSWTIVELPECMGELKHLQFLALYLAEVVLPKSIGKLRNLQTLTLACSCIREVPNIKLLAKLRHLNIDRYSLQEMPQGTGYLTNLQALNTFVLAAGGGSRISELKNLNHLHKKLTISGLANVIKVEDAKDAQLHEKKSLDELHLDWGTCGYVVDDNTKRDVLDHLQPHTSIKKCELKGYMGLAFPGWLGDPSFTHMVHITLEKCEKCECLPPLGQLPMLKTLWVSRMNGIKEVGPEFYGHCSTPFPALKTLYVEHMKSWEKWLHSPVDYNGAFPYLENLEIDDCESLQGDLPPLLPSLKILKISKCKEMSVSIPSLPLLEVLEIEGCKVLSISGDVIFCSKRVFLKYISHINGMHWRFSNLREELTISTCQSSPITVDQIPVVLRHLKIDDWSGVQSLEFESTSSLTPCLEKFSVSYCESIVSIGHIPSMLQSLEISSCQKLRVVEFNELPKGYSGNDEKTLITEEGVGFSPKATLELPLLTKLRVLYCPSLLSLREGLLLPALKTLDFSFCENMERLPCELHNLTSLQQLSITLCPKIIIFLEGSLPRNLTTLEIIKVSIKQPVQDWGLHLLTSLHKLNLADVGSSADSTEYFPSSDHSLPSSLSVLEIKGFQNLRTMCCSSLPNLNKIIIESCPMLESLDGDFTSLEWMTLENLPQIRFFPEGGLPRNLTRLSIYETSIDKPIQEWGLHLLTSLHYLTLVNVGSSTDSGECISNLLLPSSLWELYIKGFRNLKTISCSTLPNLTEIKIKSCPKLESFGDNGLPLKIREVNIEDCDSIEQHLKTDPHGRIHTKNGRYSLC